MTTLPAPAAPSQGPEPIDPGDWDQFSPNAAGDVAGNTFAVWQDTREGAPRIRFAERPAGGDWQPSLKLDPTAAGDQVDPHIAVDGSGNLYAAWTDYRGSTGQVYFAYRPAGGDWGASEVISPTTEAQERISLAVNRRGEAVVSWRQGTTWPNYNVFTSLRSASGDWGAAEQVNTLTGNSIINTSIALDDWGRAYVAWEDWDEDQIFFAERSPDGSWSADEPIRDSSTYFTWGIQIAVDGAGNVHAVWEDTRSGVSEIYAAYRPAGGPWSVNVRIDEGSGNMWSPGLGIDGAGNAIAAWSEMNRDVYGAVRYLGSGWGPSELLVTAPTLSSRSPFDTPYGHRTSPLGPQAVQSWNPGMGIAAGVGWTLLTVGASVGGYPNIFAQSQNAPGHDGCGGMAATHVTAREAAYTPARPAFSGRPDACRGGNGGEEAALNGDDGFIGPPGPPEGYQAGGWHVETRLVDGQEVYVVDTPGTDGVYTSLGDAVNFASSYVYVPSSDFSLDDMNFDDLFPPDGGGQQGDLGPQAAALFERMERLGMTEPDPIFGLTITREMLETATPEQLAEIGQMLSTHSGNLVADPVLPHSGEFVYEQTFLRIPGRGLDYAFSLNYHSQLIYDGPLGWGWEHDYDRRFVSADGGSLGRQEGAGRFDVYSFDGTNFTPPAGRYTTLVSGTTGITLTDRNGRVEVYYPLSDAAAPGQLRAIADRNGNTLQFAYDGSGRLQTVTDTLGRAITYAYDGNDRLTTVSDYSGRTVTLAYDGNGDLVSITTPVVTGTPNGNDFPDGKTTVFSYTSGFDDERLNHNLTTIIAPNEVADGSLTPRTVNTYGSDGFAFDRVVAQSWGGGRANASTVPAGGEVTLVYTTAITVTDPPGAASKVVVTDRGGNVIEMWHDGAGHRLRDRQTVGGQSLVTEYTYDADGQVTSVTYPAGNRAEYVYDDGATDRRAQGNLLEARFVADAARGCDGLGGAPCADLVTAYTYEPNFQLLHTVTDPRGYTSTNAYDGQGNLIQVTFPTVTVGLAAPQAATANWTYNTHGQLLTFTDPEGNVTCYEYNTTGYRQRLTRDCGGLDATTEYGYDSVGHVTAITDSLGVRTEYVFNALDQVVKKTRAAGTALDYETLYWYDGNDNLIQRDVENVVPDLDTDFHPTGAHSRDAANPWFTTAYTYDLLDNVVTQTVEISATAQATTGYRYDPLENLVSTTDPEGNRLEYAYDERSLLRQTTWGAGAAEAITTTYEYDGNGNLVQTADGEGHRTDYVYDGFDRRVGRVDGLGNVRTWEYDANGNVVATLLRDGQDGRNPGRVFTATAPVTLTHALSHFDERGRRYQQERAFFTADVDTGAITPLTTDGNGDGWVETAYTYDRNGNLTAVTGDDGNITRYTYDGLDRRILSTDALSNTVAYGYDGNGNLVQTVATERQPDGLAPDETFTTTSAFDSVNRLVQATDNLGQTTRYAYDSRSNLVFTSDANGPVGYGVRSSDFSRSWQTTKVVTTINSHGNTALLAYDGLSRRLAETYHLRAGGVGSGAVTGQVTLAYVYDDNGNLVRRSDPNGNETTYGYDALDRLTGVAYADGTTDALVYDRANNLAQRTDANGNVVVYTYDALNRRIRSDVTRAAGVGGTTVQTWVWDGLSRRIAATDDNDPTTPADDSALEFTYDSLSNRRSEVQGSHTVSSTYDGAGNRLSLAYPGGTVLTYTYDALNRVKTIADGSGEVAAYDYIGPSRLFRRTNGNGTYATYAYDGVRRVTEIAHRLSSDDSLLTGFGYTYDRVGNRLTEIAQPGDDTTTYTYDSLYRLTGAQGPDSSVQYTYDAAGNRVQVTRGGQATSYTTNEMHEYESVDGESRTYDANGNLLSRRVVVGCIALDEVSIGGPTSGYTDTLYAFTSVITPADATTPITYTWSPGPESGQGTDSAGYRWAAPGVHTITLAAENCGGSDVATRTITIGTGVQYRIYLPLVLSSVEGLVVRGHGGLVLSKAAGLALKNRAPALNSTAVVTETVIRYEYDFAGRLLGVTKVVTVTAGGDVQVTSETIRFTYDGRGRQVSEQTESGSVRYLYAGGQVLEERDGADVLLATYVGRLTMERGGSRVFYQTDALGSVRALAGDTGSIVERVEYDPFGAPVFGAGGDESSVGNPYLFRGRRYDVESGFYASGGRRYDPDTGRHVQRGSETLGNPYTFAGNNPVGGIPR